MAQQPLAYAKDYRSIGNHPPRLDMSSLRISVAKKLQHTATRDYERETVCETLDTATAILEADRSAERWACAGRFILTIVIGVFVAGCTSIWHIDNDVWTPVLYLPQT
eukprot:6775716-Pyramimonas_sp.AAC.1